MKNFLTGLLGVVADTNPVVGGALALVNSFLPDDKKLPDKATGADIQNEYDKLPADIRAKVDERAEVELAHIQASTDKLGYMVSVESKSANSRPFIATLMAWAVFLEVMSLMAIILVAVVNKDAATLKSLSDMWVIIAFLITVPAGVVTTYFGKRTSEKKARYAAATGQPIAGIFSTIAGLMKR